MAAPATRRAIAAARKRRDGLGAAQSLARLVGRNLLQGELAPVDAVKEEGLEKELAQQLLGALRRVASRVVAAVAPGAARASELVSSLSQKNVFSAAYKTGSVCSLQKSGPACGPFLKIKSGDSVSPLFIS